MDGVRIRFYLDDETGEPHIADHGVTEEEVAEVLTRPTRTGGAGRRRGWPPGRPKQGVPCL